MNGLPIRPWSGQAFRHIPAGSAYDVLDLRFAGRGKDNRWNQSGEPTLYLASDRGVALAEFARHLSEQGLGGTPERTVSRQLYRLDVEVERVLDLRDAAVLASLPLAGAPAVFLQRDVCRSTAGFLRATTAVQGLLVPSMAFLDDPARWVLVLFLEKLPGDPRGFVRAVEPAGELRIG